MRDAADRQPVRHLYTCNPVFFALLLHFWFKSKGPAHAPAGSSKGIRGHSAAMKSHGLRLRGKQTVAARPAMAAMARVRLFVKGARMPSLAARPDAKAAKAAAPTGASTPCAGGGPRVEGGCRGSAWTGRPFARSAVGDDALDGEKERRAIVEKHFNVSWSKLGLDARANLFYHLVDQGKVDGGTAAPETTEEGCMPPPSPADSEATLHLPTHDSMLAAHGVAEVRVIVIYILSLSLSLSTSLSKSF